MINREKLYNERFVPCLNKIYSEATCAIDIGDVKVTVDWMEQNTPLCRRHYESRFVHQVPYEFFFIDKDRMKAIVKEYTKGLRGSWYYNHKFMNTNNPNWKEDDEKHSKILHDSGTSSTKLPGIRASLRRSAARRSRYGPSRMDSSGECGMPNVYLQRSIWVRVLPIARNASRCTPKPTTCVWDSLRLTRMSSSPGPRSSKGSNSPASVSISGNRTGSSRRNPIPLRASVKRSPRNVAGHNHRLRGHVLLH